MSRALRNAAWIILAAALSAAAAPPWLADLDEALKDASDTSRPLFVVALPGDSFDALLKDLVQSPPFAAAASECVLLRLDPSSDAFDGAFASASPLAALIALPNGEPQFRYVQLPSPEAVANDILAARARIRLSAAAKSAASGDVASAIASLRSVLLLCPPYPELKSALTSLAEISEKGRARIADADAMLARREYVNSKDALEMIAADYAGTDAALAASQKLLEMARDPVFIEGLETASQDVAAQKLLEKARAAEAGQHYLEAAGYYRTILKDYPDTPTARAAASAYDVIRARVDHEEKTYNDKMQRDCRSWLALADAYVSYEQPDKALVYYQRVIDVYPNTGFADIARDRMKKIR